MIMKLKMYTKGKNFLVKFVSKLFEVWTDAWKMGQDSVFWWGDSEPSPVEPLVVNPVSSMKNPEDCACLITVIILEKVREHFPSKWQTYSGKDRDGKEVAKSLMMFILHNIVHQFQSNRYLRT